MTTTPEPYIFDYPGVWAMHYHDGAAELKRWFDNYKIDKGAWFANDYEYLTIEECRYGAGRNAGIYYVGKIGEDNTAKHRVVRFEANAPPPPTFMRKPLRDKPVPQPLSMYDTMRMRYDMERFEMERMKMIIARQYFVPSMLLGVPTVPDVPPPPPPPRYRRNV